MIIPRRLAMAFAAVALLLPNAHAILWKSSEYHCSVNLPDSDPRQNPWLPMIQTEPQNGLGVTGARRTDRSAIVFLGVQKVPDAKFRLDEKSAEQLDKPYFGTGIGFLHSISEVRANGLSGYRLKGTYRYYGSNYEVVVDMYQANGMVYQLAGLSRLEIDPLKDSNIRWFMNSFRLLR